MTIIGKSMVDFSHSPFRYAGGKFYALKHILPLIPYHKVYIEPFCGGASVFFAKGKAEINWLNDIDKELINTYKIIKDKPTKLYELLKDEKALKERHGYFKNQFEPKNNLEKAARWFYLNRTSYSGIMNMQNCFWGYGDAFSLRPSGWGKRISECSNKLQNVNLTSEDFVDVIDKAPEGSFLFIDPPYYASDQSKFYTHSFTKDDHIRLAEVLKRNNQRLKFMLTYDDDKEVRDLYSWNSNIIEKAWTYTISRTDDQTKKSKRKGKRKLGTEIFVMNYKIRGVLETQSMHSQYI